MKPYRARNGICKRCSEWMIKKSPFNDICDKCKKPNGWYARKK